MENQGVILKSKIMDRETKTRNIKPKPYEFVIDVEYVPFPSKEARKEAYYTHAKLFLKAKERELKEQFTRLEQNVHGCEHGCMKIHDNSL